jgi:hypothetical protein
MNYTRAAREEAGDRLAAFSAPQPGQGEPDRDTRSRRPRRRVRGSFHSTCLMIARAVFPADTGERAYTHFPDLLGVN